MSLECASCSRDASFRPDSRQDKEIYVCIVILYVHISIHVYIENHLHPYKLTMSSYWCLQLSSITNQLDFNLNGLHVKNMKGGRTGKIVSLLWGWWDQRVHWAFVGYKQVLLWRNKPLSNGLQIYYLIELYFRCVTCRKWILCHWSPIFFQYLFSRKDVRVSITTEENSNTGLLRKSYKEKHLRPSLILFLLVLMNTGNSIIGLL